MQEAPEQTAPALEPKAERPTEAQIRAMRRQFVTLRHGTVRACGHKIDLSRQPKNNCESCWEAWFKTTDNLLVTLHEHLVTKGLASLKAQFGDKLVKQFARFLDRELNQQQEQETNGVPEEAEGSTEAESGSDSAGIGSGEIQSVIQPVGDSGQEARDDEQPDATGQETEFVGQVDQHGFTGSGQ